MGLCPLLFALHLQRELSCASLADTRAPIVASGRVIHIRRAHSNLVSVLPDPRHLLEVDLLNTVGVRVIIGMKTGCEEDNWHTLRRVAVMIAAIINLLQVRRIVHLVVEL